MWVSGRIDPGQRSCCRAASSGTGECIRSAGGGVDDWTHLVVIPAVGVVIRNHDRSAAPSGKRFKKVDGVDDESLFVQWVRISRVSILVGGGLQKAYSGQISCGAIEEVLSIILMVGGACVANFSAARWRRMVGVSRLGIVAE
jgi:hypothetical protein